MPERLNRVHVQVGAATVEIPWDSREELLERVRAVAGGEAVVRAFEAVGASRRVELDAEETALLAAVVRHWHEEVGRDRLPAGIAELRDALVDETAAGRVEPGWTE